MNEKNTIKMINRCKESIEYLSEANLDSTLKEEQIKKNRVWIKVFQDRLKEITFNRRARGHALSRGINVEPKLN